MNRFFSESANSGKSKEEVVSSTIRRLQYEQSFFSQPATRSMSGIGIYDSRHNNLRDATAPGDYFVSAGNTSYGIPHGHAGIYATNSRNIEAVGKGKTAREVARNNSLACGKAYIYRVNTSQANRNKAVSRAYSYIGRGYNANVISSNRNDWGGLNCSQLVWAAYMYGAGIDIVPGAAFIAPSNLALSPIAKLCSTLNP
ncbi:YiiX/YebB-like N1pC/P60 family cysteine hydrolase [Alloscardovia venturai]|uniref:YiiX/YebB-like N1pC/P60 family cysteine hydrolase n=1 Tax=Alloscardovia venturai TaxID=1769421 RepID=A0ABW2Y4R6_9BIFI